MGIKNKLEKITRLAKQSINMIYYNFKAKAYKNDSKYRDLWIISERGTEAKDNGFCFFEYLCKNHPEINARYVIDKKAAGEDYKKLLPYEDRVIAYGGSEHKIAYILASHAISSHAGFLEPWSYRLYKLLLDRKDKKIFIFLQHGVILHDLSEFVSKEKIKADLFITTTKREFESISSDRYGYNEGEVVQTGIARYDKLNEFELKNEILIMPTWREGIITPSYKKSDKKDIDLFVNSEYFKRFNSLINNKRLELALKKNNIKLIFYPHYEIQPYLECFKQINSELILASKEKYDVQGLLKSSKALVTDFSSIQFDFAYMRKPQVYYQFDSIEEHYKMGYFEYDRDGFGPVYDKEEEVVDYLIELMENNFEIEEKYLERINKDFNIRDSHNCDRIFDEIMKIKK
ncbi:MAG: CDP-glycerol glycerophosphotransferase family protein [Peptostreptococcus sp.]|uniref:CDP-glycerol glycerophosphotransferase family protein n=1 Tax=Peptostreptococcus sp. TaxID=1262 RepID=UPI002FC6CE43